MAAGAAFAGSGRWARLAAEVAPKSKVALARDSALRGSGSAPDSNRVLQLLDRALQACCDRDKPPEAWKRIVAPGQTVGLKVNCLGGRGLSTSTVLVEAICERLQQAGIREENIIIWDRSETDLEDGGYRNRGKVRVIGNDRAGFEDDLATFGEVGSRLTRTVTRSCDVVINLPLLKDHGVTGMTGAMKNFYGAVHNPNKYHPNAGNPYVADVNMLEPIRRKVRLHICDSFGVQYEGGPSFRPQWNSKENALLVSRDPVALDYTGWQMIERKRTEKGLPSLTAAGRAPAYIATAADARHRLGTDDPHRIEVVEL
jgi:uncharacterized protein (DUF362 family)